MSEYEPRITIVSRPRNPRDEKRNANQIGDAVAHALAPQFDELIHTIKILALATARERGADETTKRAALLVAVAKKISGRDDLTLDDGPIVPMSSARKLELLGFATRALAGDYDSPPSLRDAPLQVPTTEQQQCALAAIADAHQRLSARGLHVPKFRLEWRRDETATAPRAESSREGNGEFIMRVNTLIPAGPELRWCVHHEVRHLHDLPKLGHGEPLTKQVRAALERRADAFANEEAEPVASP
jgi:hypothetical protein